MLLAGKSLLLRRSHNLSIHYQGSSRIVIESGNSEDFHEPSKILMVPPLVTTMTSSPSGFFPASLAFFCPPLSQSYPEEFEAVPEKADLAALYVTPVDWDLSDWTIHGY